jgi:hypothetical protein
MTRAELVAGLAMAYLLGWFGFGTWHLFTTDLTALASPAAAAYASLVGVPAGGYGLWKWAKKRAARQEAEQ